MHRSRDDNLFGDLDGNCPNSILGIDMDVVRIDLSPDTCILVAPSLLINHEIKYLFLALNHV